MKLEHFANIDFVAEPIRRLMAGRQQKRGAQGSINIDCPICHLRRESGFGHDKKQRCGVWLSSNEIGIKCFNCAFKTKFMVGGYLGKPIQFWMEGLGVPSLEVKKLALQAATIKKMIDTSTPEIQAQIPLLRTETEIKARSLPEGARPIHEWAEEGCTDPNFLEVCEYLLSRGSHLAGATTYYWTPNAQEHHFNRRLIIPYYHYGKIVGWTGRVTHSSLPSKYWNVIPEGLLYNTAALHDPKRSIAIIVEGVLDAVAIDCVGTNGNNLSQYQIDTIRDSGKRIIVLPDRDTAGKSLIDIAMKYDWEVSFPRITGRSGLQRGWWDHSTTHGFIKDAAEAVNKYGVLYTVRSIIESSVKGNIRIGQIRKLSSLFT